ncbi:hypothetical protein BX600DRAFT_429118 [Xylariales sp. PMI_506]|nr:hypothetical protein BX600DRAFT_429118 [Xylariales sp. PMI_506]
MGAKRSRDEEGASAPAAKKARKGFRVGPENLPDGPWRRKVTKIKNDLIQKAKIKKAYAKIKAAEQREEQPNTAFGGQSEEADGSDEKADNNEVAGDSSEPKHLEIHPERQARLDGEEDGREDDDENGDREPNRGSSRRRTQQRRPPAQDADSPAGSHPRAPHHTKGEQRRGNSQRRPDYFARDRAHASQAQAQREQQQQEAQRRNEERERKTKDRERFRQAMAKAKKPGRDGRRRLGRESALLLEKAQRMVAGGK